MKVGRTWVVGLVAGATILMAFLIVECFLLIVLPAYRWRDSAVRESQRRGDVIVDAIDRYRKDTGYYPFALLELQPVYLKEIDTPTAGTQKWVYDRTGYATGFILAFGEGEYLYPNCSYDSTEGKWVDDR